MLMIFASWHSNTLPIIVVLYALNIIIAVGEEVTITIFFFLQMESCILNDLNLII